MYIIFIFLSHFWPRDPDSGPTDHIFVTFLVIFFSYYFHIIVYAWAGAPVHSAIFEIPDLSDGTGRLSTGGGGQRLTWLSCAKSHKCRGSRSKHRTFLEASQEL